MNMSDYFLLPDSRLRAGWRLALFVVLYLAALFAVGLAASIFVHAQSVALEVGVLAATTGGSTWLLLRWMERQPLVSIGFAWRRESWAEVRTGYVVGGALVAGLTAVEWGIGAIRFESAGEAGTGVLAFAAVTAILVISATTEETLFRGYAFQRLIEGSNGAVAVAASSVVFGWLHATNPHATRLSILNTILAGVLLGLAYLKTRALWLPVGFHFGWNWTLLALGHPVSGLVVAEMPWHAVPAAGLIWLHGGSYGPEGGIVATTALVGGTFYLLRKAGASRTLAGESGSPLPPEETSDFSSPRQPREPN